MTYQMPPGAEIAPGIRDYWAAVTDVPCPACQRGTIRWAEAGNVPGFRGCDGCGREFIAHGRADAPTLVEWEEPND